MTSILRGCGTALAVVLLLLGSAYAWFVWQGSDRSLPPIARGLSGSFPEGDRFFKARVAARYPIGVAERAIVADLTRQGFDVSRYRAPGYWNGQGRLTRLIGCGGKKWDVRWKAERGRVTEVLGVYGANCL